MKITDVEFLILQLIYERKEVSWNEVVIFLRELNMGWTIPSKFLTSGCLIKLIKLQVLECTNPISNKKCSDVLYRITRKGEYLLRQEVLRALSLSRERDQKFDIALAAISLLSMEEVTGALIIRIWYLKKMDRRLHELLAKQDAGVASLYGHPMYTIRNEIQFTNTLISHFRNVRQGVR